MTDDEVRPAGEAYTEAFRWMTEELDTCPFCRLRYRECDCPVD